VSTPYRLFVLLAQLALAAIPLTAASAEMTAIDFSKQVYRGFTLDNIFLKTATAKDFDDLARFGVNLVRTGIDLQSCDHCKAYTLPADWLQAVDRVVGWAGERHIRVILTMVPEKQPVGALYWDNRDLQDSVISTWAKLAERYRGNQGMGGFDLINEPAPPGGAQEASRRYVDFAGRIIAAVRKIDPLRMIVFEPAPRGNMQYGFKSLSVPLPFDNVLYSPHFYKPAEITHQGIKGFDAKVSYPSSLWNKTKLAEEFEYARAFSRKYKMPLYVGEFSCMRTAPGDTAYNWNKDAIELFEAEGWSWTYHSFRGWHGFDPELPSGTPQPKDPATAPNLRRLDSPVMTLLRGYLQKNSSPAQ
jgi:hypothetical protein